MPLWDHSMKNILPAFTNPWVVHYHCCTLTTGFSCVSMSTQPQLMSTAQWDHRTQQYVDGCSPKTEERGTTRICSSFSMISPSPNDSSNKKPFSCGPSILSCTEEQWESWDVNHKSLGGFRQPIIHLQFPNLKNVGCNTACITYCKD